MRLKNICEIYTATVKVEFGKLSTVMDWCRKNCTGNWYIANYNAEWYNVSERRVAQFENWYSFDFDNECDFITFNLKFK